MRALSLAGLVAGACVSLEPEMAARGVHTTVTDTAGIAIAHTTGTPVDTARLGRGLVEALRIGTVDGDEKLQFHRVWAMRAHHASGEIYVANAGTYSVRVFDANGAFVREIGRQGSGPGEFQFPSRLWFAGDTLFAVDGRLSRTTAFNRAGEHLTDWGTDHMRSVNPIAQAAGRWIVAAFVSYTGEWKPGADQTSHTWYLSTPVPRQGQSIADLAADTIVRVPLRQSIGIQTPIFVTARSPMFAPSPTAAADESGRLFVSLGAPYRVDVYEHGTLAGRIVREHTPRPVLAEYLDEYRRRARAYHDTVSVKNPEYAAAYAADMAQPDLPTPATLPPLGRLLVARDGAFWIERIDLLDDPVAREWTRGAPLRTTLWDRFDVGGRFLGPVELPVRFNPMDVTAASVLGVQRNEDGVEFVVRYNVSPPAR